MPNRLIAAGVAVLALILFPETALACACGCSVFSVGAGSLLPTDHGGSAWLEYDYMNQNKNWSGDKSAPAGDNSDKQIKTDFVTLGGQYMFTCGWGVMVEAPVWNREFRTDDGSGTIDRFQSRSLGDVRLTAIYTGFSKAMTTGLTLGLKLPTGDYHARGYDRDTQIGSGSTDIVLGTYHVGSLSRDDSLTYFAKGQWEIPVITVGGYRPGQTIDAAGGVIYRATNFDNDKASLSPLLQLIGSARTADSGDAANPGDSGYSRLLLSPGLELRTDKWRLYGDVKFPIYQHVRGNQLIAPQLFTVVVSRSF